MKTMQDLFNFIRLMAENPLDEIYPRHIWCFLEQNPEYDIKRVLTIKEFVEQSCGIAAMGIAAALAGSTAKWSKIKNKDQYLTNNYRLCTKESFFIYEFGIKVENHDTDPVEELDGHKFLVIQYKDKDNQPCYTFLQAYAKNYSLADFLKNAEQGTIKQHFTHEEFMQFLTELDGYVASGEINTSFNKQYFHAVAADAPVNIKKKLEIYSTSSNLFQVELANDYFQRYKKSDRYPEFTFIPNNHTESIQFLNNPSDEGGDEIKEKCLVDTPAYFEQRMIANESLEKLLKEPSNTAKVSPSHFFYHPHQTPVVSEPVQKTTFTA